MDQTIQTLILCALSALIILEAVVSTVGGLKLYRLKDTWANISVGVIGLVINGLYRGVHPVCLVSST